MQSGFGAPGPLQFVADARPAELPPLRPAELPPLRPAELPPLRPAPSSAASRSSSCQSEPTRRVASRSRLVVERAHLSCFFCSRLVQGRAPYRELRVARGRAPSSCRDESGASCRGGSRSSASPRAPRTRPRRPSRRRHVGSSSGGALPAPSRGSRCSAPLTRATRRGTDGAVTNVGRAAWPGAARQLLRGRPRRGSPLLQWLG
jgi:hypothetical protein